MPTNQVLLNAIKDLETRVKNDIKQLEEALTFKIRQTSTDAAEAKASATANAIAIQELRNEMKEVKRECCDLRRENEELKLQTNNIETYSRKNNIIFHGITDDKAESNAQCADAVRTFMKTVLKMDEHLVRNIRFAKCHRLKAINITRHVLLL